MSRNYVHNICNRTKTYFSDLQLYFNSNLGNLNICITHWNVLWLKVKKKGRLYQIQLAKDKIQYYRPFRKDAARYKPTWNKVWKTQLTKIQLKSVLGINCCIFLKCRDHSQSWKLQLTLGEHTEAQFEVWELQFKVAVLRVHLLIAPNYVLSIGSLGFFWIMFKTVEKGFLPAST